MSNCVNESIHHANYEDLGIVIDVTNMAAGAIVYSNWFDNVQWVRNFVTLSSSDQQFDIYTSRRDTSLVADYTNVIKTGQAATGANWISLTYTPANATPAGSLLGYSAKFGIKNTSASPNTFAKLKVQLMGL